MNLLAMPDDKFSFNLNALRERINLACERSGRDPRTVELMAVSKRQTAAAVAALVASGIYLLGENRVQEGEQKRPQVAALLGARSADAEVTGERTGPRWELIGPLQSNKVRLAVATFEGIQTVDRPRLVERLAAAVQEQGRAPYPVLLQVNVGHDPAKHGCDPAAAADLLALAQDSGVLAVQGLMTIGALSEDETVVRRTFADLRELRDRLEQRRTCRLPVLSMGMSGDLEWAIEEGSTLIRVGTALFGKR